MAATKQEIDRQKRKKLADLQARQDKGLFLTDDELGTLQASTNPTEFKTGQELGSAQQSATPFSAIPDIDAARRSRAADGSKGAVTTDASGLGSASGRAPKLGQQIGDGGQSNITKTVEDLGDGIGRATFTGEGIPDTGVATITASLGALTKPSKGTFSTVSSVTGGGPGTLNPDNEIPGQPLIDAINERFNAQFDEAQQKRQRVLGEIRVRDALKAADKQNAPINKLINNIRSGRETRPFVINQLDSLAAQAQRNTEAALNLAQSQDQAEAARLQLGAAQEKQTFDRAFKLQGLDLEQQKSTRDEARRQALDSFDQYIKSNKLNIAVNKEERARQTEIRKTIESYTSGKTTGETAVSVLRSLGLDDTNIRRFLPGIQVEEQQ